MTTPDTPARAQTARDVAELLDKIELGLCIGTEADLAVSKFEGNPDRTDSDILAAHAALAKLRELLAAPPPAPVAGREEATDNE